MTEQPITPEEEEEVRKQQSLIKEELDLDDQDAEPAENFDQEPKDAAVIDERPHVVKVLDEEDL